MLVCGGQGYCNEVPQTGWLNRNLASHSPGGWKLEMKVSAGLVPAQGCEGESVHASLLAPGDLLATFGIPWLVGASPWSLPSSSHGVLRVWSSFWIQMSTFCKNISCIGLRPVLMTLLCCQNYGFSRSHVWMWELGYKESWAPKNWCFWTMVLKKTLENPLDCKEIQPVHSEGDQPWDFFGRNDAKAETPVL